VAGNRLVAGGWWLVVAGGGSGLDTGVVDPDDAPAGVDGAMDDDGCFTIEPPCRERRAHPRHEFPVQVSVRHMRTTYVMDIANLGHRGVFVKADDARNLARIRAGEELELDVSTHDGLESLRVAARVVHVVSRGDPSRRGFGAKFVRVSPRASERIAQIVDQLARLAASRPPPLPPTRGGSAVF